MRGLVFSWVFVFSFGFAAALCTCFGMVVRAFSCATGGTHPCSCRTIPVVWCRKLLDRTVMPGCVVWDANPRPCFSPSLAPPHPYRPCLLLTSPPFPSSHVRRSLHPSCRASSPSPHALFPVHLLSPFFLYITFPLPSLSHSLCSLVSRSCLAFGQLLPRPVARPQGARSLAEARVRCSTGGPTSTTQPGTLLPTSSTAGRM